METMLGWIISLSVVSSAAITITKMILKFHKDREETARIERNNFRY